MRKSIRFPGSARPEADSNVGPPLNRKNPLVAQTSRSAIKIRSVSIRYFSCPGSEDLETYKVFQCRPGGLRYKGGECRPSDLRYKEVIISHFHYDHIKYGQRVIADCNPVVVIITDNLAQAIAPTHSFTSCSQYNGYNHPHNPPKEWLDANSIHRFTYQGAVLFLEYIMQ